MSAQDLLDPCHSLRLGQNIVIDQLLCMMQAPSTTRTQ